eukprot:gene4740-6026_t
MISKAKSKSSNIGQSRDEETPLASSTTPVPSPPTDNSRKDGSSRPSNKAVTIHGKHRSPEGGQVERQGMPMAEATDMWRAHLLQRLTIQLPPVCRSVIPLISVGAKEEVLEQLQALLGNCRRFLGTTLVGVLLLVVFALADDPVLRVRRCARRALAAIKRTAGEDWDVRMRGELCESFLTQLLELGDGYDPSHVLHVGLRREEYLRQDGARGGAGGGGDSGPGGRPTEVNLKGKVAELVGLGVGLGPDLRSLIVGRGRELARAVGHLFVPASEESQMYILESRRYFNLGGQSSRTDPSREGSSAVRVSGSPCVDGNYYRCNLLCTREDDVKRLLRRLGSVLGRRGYLQVMHRCAESCYRNILKLGGAEVMAEYSGGGKKELRSNAGVGVAADEDEEEVGGGKNEGGTGWEVEVSSYRAVQEAKEKQLQKYLSVLAGRWNGLCSAVLGALVPHSDSPRDSNGDEERSVRAETGDKVEAEDVVDPALLLSSEELLASCRHIDSHCDPDTAYVLREIIRSAAIELRWCLGHLTSTSIQLYEESLVTGGGRSSGRRRLLEGGSYSPAASSSSVGNGLAVLESSRCQEVLALACASMIECVGHCGLVLGPVTRPLMMEVLFVLLQLSVCPVAVCRQAASTTIDRLGLYMGYNSTVQLLRDNLDYIVDEACAHLRELNRSSSHHSVGHTRSAGSSHGRIQPLDDGVTPMVVNLVFSVLGEGTFHTTQVMVPVRTSFALSTRGEEEGGIVIDCRREEEKRAAIAVQLLNDLFLDTLDTVDSQAALRLLSF